MFKGCSFILLFILFKVGSGKNLSSLQMSKDSSNTHHRHHHHRRNNKCTKHNTIALVTSKATQRPTSKLISSSKIGSHHGYGCSYRTCPKFKSFNSLYLNSLLENARGGGVGEFGWKTAKKGVSTTFNAVQSSHDENSNNVEKSKVNKKIVSVLVLAMMGIIITINRDAVSSFNFKEVLANQLDSLSAMGTKGLITYVIVFMLWELIVGVTTPVETAAGMAFGFKNGIIANAIGKTSGAIFAFLLGRFVLKDYVTKKLEGNEYMDLVKDSITKTPIKVALIWRFSFLPEQIKNFGLAILPVKTWQFVTAVLLHGFPFTVLWSFMGNEMGLLVKGVVTQPTKILKVLVAGVYVLGFFVSPSLVGLWVKGLRDEKIKREKDLNEKN